MTCVHCDRPVLARQMCSKHYTRWRSHGDPLKVTGTKRGAPLEFLKAAMESDADGCVLWPFSQYTSGYGSVWYNKRLTGAHRAMCEIANGSPARDQQVAHYCGVRLCVNPRHLRWACPVENAKDKLRHGTSGRGEQNPQAKLTARDVKKIREMATLGKTQTSIASQFNVSRRSVGMILTGDTWRHI